MNQTQPKLGNGSYIPPNKRNNSEGSEVSPQKKTAVEITSGVGRIDIGGRKNAEPVVDMKKIKENKPKSPIFKLQPRVLTKPKGLPNENEEKSHCHVDMIYNRLKCSFEDGLSKWMSNYQQSFNQYFIGCIPNFIEPHLFVNTKLTKDDYNMS
ncbi:unnamed protein product [Caenorhabditis angaria]|uniref:Uncharacterized protein n=1 Tax=Caenorhabditis angaria TaxID=860376 RepID=A0A9P1I3N9_9PELO|nr:unnamed protein product [Caenorhabditis angaria]